MNANRVFTITRKEFIHITRDRASLIMSFMIPVVMLLIFGFAINTDVSQVETVFYNADNSSVSRDVISSFSNSHYFKSVGEGSSQIDAETFIKKGEAKVAVVIPSGFGRKVDRGESAEYQIMIDGSDPMIARTAGSYAVLLSSNVAGKYAPSGMKIVKPLISAKPAILYNPTMESSKFNVPGVVGLILQNITIILTSLAIVKEKELGTIEQLIMTPVTPLELVVGKLIPYIVIACYDFVIVLALSHLIFGMDVMGSILELSALGIVFLTGALSMGMLISSVSQTQSQAILLGLVFLLPSVLLSGFMFPRESMPEFIYALSTIFPITHFLVILRGIIVKGVPAYYMMGSVAALLMIVFVLIAATARSFTKKLD